MQFLVKLSSCWNQYLIFFYIFLNTLNLFRKCTRNFSKLHGNQLMKMERHNQVYDRRNVFYSILVEHFQIGSGASGLCTMRTPDYLHHCRTYTFHLSNLVKVLPRFFFFCENLFFIEVTTMYLWFSHRL